jgi:DNA primase
MALGGSSISEAQIMLIRAAGPELIVTAFDQDHGGFDGSVGICKKLGYELGCQVVPTFSPEGNDWNDFLKRHGFQATMQAFAERIRSARSMSVTSAIVTQYRGGR